MHQCQLNALFGKEFPTCRSYATCNIGLQTLKMLS